MSKVIIIGGGASGLVTAIFASLNNDVTILEKNSKCGKKILATGNGKCNYFNSDFTTSHFNTDNKESWRKRNRTRICHVFAGNSRTPGNGSYRICA